MNLSDVKHVIEICEPHMVSKYIALGWELLQICPSKNAGFSICYVLGSKEAEPERYDPYSDTSDDALTF